MAREKVRLHLLKGDEIDAESVLALFAAIAGRKPTPEEVADVRREIQEWEDESQRRKGR